MPDRLLLFNEKLRKFLEWLGIQDSNLAKQIQSLLSYR
jgi:hypothetical protein